MTEIGLAALNPPTVVDKLGSIGMPSPGFVFSIRSEDGGEVSSGKEGRLFVRTPSRTAGYWNDPGASAEVIREEWLDTGDVMRADDDGYLWFCGRNKQIIVHDGSNISPQEVEDALLAHPAVESAGVIGLHDRGPWRERPRLCCAQARRHAPQGARPDPIRQSARRL